MGNREKLNRFLEDWYNRGGPERPSFVPYHRFLGPRQYQFPNPAAAGQIDSSQVRPATINTVQELIEEHLKRPLDRRRKATPNALGPAGAG